MADIKALPLTGIANSNDDLSKHFRQMADSIEKGEFGDIQNIYLIYENDDGTIRRQTIGKRCDKARALGVITMAVAMSATNED
jgi:hypothetical protein